MPTPMPISPFIDESLPRFKLDEGAFMAELAAELAGLTLGREPDRMRAAEMMPVLEVLAGH
jgi:hypothetical protein